MKVTLYYSRLIKDKEKVMSNHEIQDIFTVS